ncbi:LysR family transcriptional regulator [Streptomyces sp. H39-S7]|uniref:LysR family transcriptional regulator n=1 Tax=Streptomyces sp. H39-S7 TaxID=3004357 RepID=UPI0022AEC868|nr:LysR family transcriptional regulator [Streptomyces sp. H39-S7]MCZ4120978.1 LysR family transcriptional regulator [Streptomyces sp. H39-S7]
MELDPRRLRVLRAVALRGGVMDAARLLHLSPSAVSQQLVQLEREVGLPLVDRSRRRVGLTPAGRLLAARAERIEQELAEARRELTELSGRVVGPVTIAAFSTAVCHLLAPALRSLQEAHPELQPRVVELEGPSALRELRTGGCDLVVTEHDGGNAASSDGHDLASAPVADDEYRVVTPVGWPRPASVRDLADRPWIACPEDTACGRALLRICADHGFTARRDHVCREFPTVLAMVAAGAGAAVVPTLALGRAASAVVAVPAVSGVGHRRISALFRRSGPEPLTSAVVGALRVSAEQAGLIPAPHDGTSAAESSRGRDAAEVSGPP